MVVAIVDPLSVQDDVAGVDPDAAEAAAFHALLAALSVRPSTQRFEKSR